MSDESDKLPVAIQQEVARASLAILAAFLLAFGWAFLAPVATTIRVSGEVSSTSPSHPVQHSRGGKIASVEVQLHDRVQEGDLLFRFDMTENELRRDALRLREGRLVAERHEIAMRLEGATGQRAFPSDPVVHRVYAERDSVLAVRMESGEAEIQGMRERRRNLQSELALNRELRDLIATRLEKSRRLAAKGILAETEIELIRQELLETEVAISRQVTEINGLGASMKNADHQKAATRSEFLKNLAEARVQVEQELAEVQAELTVIAHSMAESEVHAPVSGMVSSLEFSSGAMVAAPGATLALISQPVNEPEIRIHIPTSKINQVSVGQIGKLAINGIPPRQAPDLTVELRSIAEEPEEDPKERTSYYVAHAVISKDDLEIARANMSERLHLVLGMPVSVALIGGKTTLWEYIVAPLLSIWETAFEA